MIYESHSHTPLCKHAQGMPTEYAERAHQVGLTGITITCHNPMPNRFSHHVRMDLAEWDEYQRIVEEARVAWEGTVDVRLGLEADYYPGYVDFVREQINRNDLSYVIGSVHPQTPEYRRDYRSDDALADQITYFNMLADAAETELFDCISHPDLIKNEFVDDWSPDRVMDVIAKTLDRIAATGTAMELNTSGVNKRIPEMNPFPEMLQMMCQRSIPLVIGGDAHQPQRVGDGFLQALELAATAGYAEVQYFVERTPQRVAIAEARSSLVAQA